MENIMFFGRSDRSEDDHIQLFLKHSSEISTSATWRNNSHIRSMSSSRDFLFRTGAPKWFLGKPLISFLKKIIIVPKNKKWNDQHVYLISVFLKKTRAIKALIIAVWFRMTAWLFSCSTKPLRCPFGRRRWSFWEITRPFKLDNGSSYI
jgi:hypothetical protein